MFKVDNRNTRKRFELCPKVIMKASERRHWRRYDTCFVNFEHISHFFLLFLLLTLNKYLFVGMFLSRLWSNECSKSFPLFTFAPLWFLKVLKLFLYGFFFTLLFLFFSFCVSHLCSCFGLPHVSWVLHALVRYKHSYTSLLSLCNQLCFPTFWSC